MGAKRSEASTAAAAPSFSRRQPPLSPPQSSPPSSALGYTRLRRAPPGRSTLPPTTAPAPRTPKPVNASLPRRQPPAVRTSASVIPVVLRASSVRIKSATARTIARCAATQQQAALRALPPPHDACVNALFLIRTEEARRTTGITERCRMLLAGELTEQVIGLAIEVRRYASTWPHRQSNLARLMVMAMHRNCATESPNFSAVWVWCKYYDLRTGSPVWAAIRMSGLGKRCRPTERQQWAQSGSQCGRLSMSAFHPERPSKSGRRLSAGSCGLKRVRIAAAANSHNPCAGALLRMGWPRRLRAKRSNLAGQSAGASRPPAEKIP